MWIELEPLQPIAPSIPEEGPAGSSGRFALAPRIRAYPREATIAEKFNAMVVLDIRNSRMKGFYDIWFMATTREFDMEPLRTAIFASFERRGITVPKETPFALTDEFLNDAQKKQQWKAFAIRLNPGSTVPQLDEVETVLRAFLMPCIVSGARGVSSFVHWTPDSHRKAAPSE